MTVELLIRMLKGFPQHLEVRVQIYDDVGWAQVPIMDQIGGVGVDRDDPQLVVLAAEIDPEVGFLPYEDKPEVN